MNLVNRFATRLKEIWLKEYTNRDWQLLRNKKSSLAEQVVPTSIDEQYV